MKKQLYLAYISCDKLWRDEFHSIVAAKDRVQDINPNQFKLKLNDTHETDEKIATNYEHFDSSDVEDFIMKA